VSCNKYLPHVLVLPEDDDNLRLANEFHLQINQLRQMQLLPVAEGWVNVLDLFESVHVKEMERCPHRFMILLIDFDGDGNRLQVAKARIPQALMDRVFVLGVWSEPEELRAAEGSYKDIGLGMAEDCRLGTSATWGKPLLQHNVAELNRLRQHVVPTILFPP
jgi:hypothetical protein